MEMSSISLRRKMKKVVTLITRVKGAPEVGPGASRGLCRRDTGVSGEGRLVTLPISAATIPASGSLENHGKGGGVREENQRSPNGCHGVGPLESHVEAHVEVVRSKGWVGEGVVAVALLSFGH